MQGFNKQQVQFSVSNTHVEICKLNFPFPTHHFEDYLKKKEGGGSLLGYGPLLQILWYTFCKTPLQQFFTLK